MEIQKRCIWCGKSFIAHKMTTLYCSHSCNGKAYKEQKKKERLAKYIEKEDLQPLPSTGCIGNKDFLSPAEVATLLGVSRATIYRYMISGLIRALQLKARTIIRRSDVEKMFNEAPSYRKRSYGRKEATIYYTINEIIEKYKIMKKTIYRRCERFDIPKIAEGGRVYYNKVAIDKHFAELIEDIDYDAYYTPEQIMEKYGMTRAAVTTYAMRHNIPRINRHHAVFYSKVHIDRLKESSTEVSPDYYTFKEIKEKYGLTSINISYYVNKYNIDRCKKGSRTLVSRVEFDRIIKEHKDGTYQKNKVVNSTPKNIKPKAEENAMPQGYYSAEEIAKMYTMSKKTVCKLARENNIPKINHKGFAYYERLSVTTFFSKYKFQDDVKAWLSGQEIEEIYQMTPNARRSFTSRHDIPTQIVYGKTYYSKDHIDMVKNNCFDNKDNYYSVTEVMEKFNLRRDEIYSYSRFNKIRKYYQGKSMYMLKEDFDKIMLERLGLK